MTIIGRIALYSNIVFVDHMQGGNNGIDRHDYHDIQSVLVETQRRLNEPLTEEMKNGKVSAWKVWSQRPGSVRSEPL